MDLTVGIRWILNSPLLRLVIFECIVSWTREDSMHVLCMFSSPNWTGDHFTCPNRRVVNHMYYMTNSWSTVSSDLTSCRKLPIVQRMTLNSSSSFLRLLMLGLQVCAHCVWFMWCWGQIQSFLHARQLLHQLSYICSSWIIFRVSVTILNYTDPLCTSPVLFDTIL